MYFGGQGVIVQVWTGVEGLGGIHEVIFSALQQYLCKYVGVVKGRYCRDIIR